MGVGHAARETAAQGTLDSAAEIVRGSVRLQRLLRVRGYRRPVAPASVVSGGYGCTRNASAASDCEEEGWGTDTMFTEEDDRDICALLNRHGMPANADDLPSPLHFYRSAIHFHRRFRRWEWRALVKHLRERFTTTMSDPHASLENYRGWDPRDTLVTA